MLKLVTFPEGSSELTFAFGQPRSVTKMFARRLRVSFGDPAQQTTAAWTIEGSGNGASWEVLAELHGGQAVLGMEPVELAPVGSVKQVRIRSASDAGFTLVYSNEVSFY